MICDNGLNGRECLQVLFRAPALDSGEKNLRVAVMAYPMMSQLLISNETDMH
jgi:hypothetical protein